MRTVTAPELAILAAPTSQKTKRVKVKNGSGTWIDLTSWVEENNNARDIDQPVDGLTIAFRRDSGTTQSLSPLRTDSTLNRLDDGTTFSPQLDVNREIKWEVATTALGAVILETDYKFLFHGTIDNVSFERSPMVCTCRDQGGLLVDRWIEALALYGSVAGVPVEDVMGQVLNATLGGLVPLTTLGLPTWPAYDISPEYVQQIQPMMEAMSALAQLPGGDARYLYDSGTNTFKFMLHEPPRSKTTPDHTFGPSDYITATRLELDLTNIKNVITISYPDLAQNGHLSVTVFDAASITKYGRRYMFIQEPTGSPINTSAQATAMANNILWDLKDPKAEFEIDMPFFWPAELWDLYRFSPNTVHFDTNQDWAVVSLTHHLSRNQHRTKLQVRGLPAGAYHAWRGRGDPDNPRPGEVGPEAHIEEMGGSTNPGVENILYYGTGGTQPYTYERRLDVDTISTGTWSAPAALGSGVTEWITTDPYYATRIYLRVTDATGLVGNADPFFLMGDLPAVDKTTGAIDGGQIDATSIPTGALANSAVTTAKIADANVTPAKTQARNRCKLFNTTDWATLNNVNKVLDWDSEEFDSNTLHSGASPTRITVPTGGNIGVWMLVAQVSWQVGTGGSRTVRIRKNGTIISDTQSAQNGETRESVTAIDDAPAVGDYFEAEVVQSDGGGLDCHAADSNGLESFFAAVHLW